MNSRSEVNLTRKIRFENGVEWEGIPIIAANMTTIGTLDVYKVLSKYKIITALLKERIWKFQLQIKGTS